MKKRMISLVLAFVVMFATMLPAAAASGSSSCTPQKGSGFFSLFKSSCTGGGSANGGPSDAGSFLKRFLESYLNRNSNSCSGNSCEEASCTGKDCDTASGGAGDSGCTTKPTKPTEPTRPTPPTTPDPQEPSIPGNSSTSSYEDQVVTLVNQERAKYNLAPLTMDNNLAYVARMKSQDMRDNGYFSHTSPTYGSPFDMMRQFGISYRVAGENIARGQSTPASVVQAWMNSEGHRANILNTSYTKIGVGYVSGGNHWTQMFIG